MKFVYQSAVIHMRGKEILAFPSQFCPTATLVVMLTNINRKHNYVICVYVAIGDFTIANMMNVIPPGVSEACLQLQAVDDEIVEDDEYFTVTVETGNSNDMVNGTTLLIISDNDGKGIPLIFGMQDNDYVA